ncbi:hypothetical protein MYXO_03116 [Myxococcaceae bacterium]|nr:hypothetical protein MYXO_03116 [Myxococcaceae bacterium]
MRRDQCVRGVAIAVAALLLGLGADAAEKSKRKPPADYFPLRLESWWQYRSTQANGAASEFRITVISEERAPDGTLRACLELRNPNPLIVDCYAKSATEVLRTTEEYLGGGGRVAFDPPRPLLRLPLRDAAQWSWSGNARLHTRVDERSRVVGREKVEVPAGRFETIRILTEIEQGGARATKTSWYAAGVGLVRQTTESSGIGSTTELTERGGARRR